MKRSLKNRIRKDFLENLYRSGSLKIAIRDTALKFEVSEGSLRTDWFRLGTWPKELFQAINDPINDFLSVLEIRNSLHQLDSLIRRCRKQQNLNAELGAIKSKNDTIFKLINIRRTIREEDFLERLETLEADIKKLKDVKQEAQKG